MSGDVLGHTGSGDLLYHSTWTTPSPTRVEAVGPRGPDTKLVAVNTVDAVGGDFLRAWVDVAGAAGERGADLLQRIRADLVDGLNFSTVVDWFL